MRALAVAEAREVLFCESEDFSLPNRKRKEELEEEGAKNRLTTHLINPTELEIAIEVLLVESLKPWVKQPAQQRTRNLLHYLRTGLLRIVLGDGRA